MTDIIESINVCRIVDKHLKSLALGHVDTKFIKLDAEVSMNSPFSITLQKWKLVFSQAALVHLQIRSVNLK